MRVVTTLEEWLTARRTLGTQTVGLVPTMGALHDGHLSLIERSASENDVTVATVFVNATQFNDTSDLEAYPQQLAEDARLAERAGAELVLAPGHDAVYPDGYRYRVSENGLSLHMEGAHRPGHFDGVLSVVLKLLNIVQPRRAYFGEKDYQQLLLIRGMVEAFFLPVEIVACPTVRADDGLALSSRNARLSAGGRALAPNFHRVLASAADSGEARERLSELGFQVDYVVDSDGRRFGAVMIDGVRLIDNLPLRDDKD